MLEYSVEKHYIHKSFLFPPPSPKTTRNMNLALLFSDKNKALKFQLKYNIPKEFLPTFIPIELKIELKSNYNNYDKLVRGPISDYLPDFLQDV